VTDRHFPAFQTERLDLRAITMDDAEWFLAHFSTPEIVYGQGFPAPADVGAAREQLAQYIVDLFANGDGLRWGIKSRGQDTLIGSAGFYDWDREVGSAELGYDLVPAYWGQGIMTEALTAILGYGFDAMALNRVQVLVMPRNQRSLSLAGRLGFVREGVLRDHGVDETGAVCDDVILSLLRREWGGTAVRQASALDLRRVESPPQSSRENGIVPDNLFPELETARLHLREITMDDADWLLAHRSAPAIVHGQGFPAPVDITEAREQMARFILDLFARGEGLRWGIAMKGDDALVGSAGFDDWDHTVRSVEMDYDLEPGRWGQGIMTEALTAILDHGFGAMGLKRVQVLVMPRNERSLRLVRRLGFVREGVLRDHGVDETGTIRDDVTLSLLRREWDGAAVR